MFEIQTWYGDHISGPHPTIEAAEAAMDPYDFDQYIAPIDPLGRWEWQVQAEAWFPAGESVPLDMPLGAGYKALGYEEAYWATAQAFSENPKVKGLWAEVKGQFVALGWGQHLVPEVALCALLAWRRRVQESESI